MLYCVVLWTPTAKATEAQDLHRNLHFATGAAATFLAYGLWKAALDGTPWQKDQALLWGALTVIGACVIKEMADASDDPNTFSSRDLLYGGMGVGGAVLTITVFDF